MGHRLSKIYTKTGDEGTTGLTDGSRVSKSDIIVDAMGDTDELNSSIGLLLSQNPPKQDLIKFIQNKLFDIGAEIATKGYHKVTDEDVQALEQSIDEMNESLPPLKEFILPRGDLATCFCHMSRSICRRAERKLVQVSQTHEINAVSLKFVNRLSDWLFVFARTLSKASSEPELMWEHEKTKKPQP